jgi:hypothetical protein
MSKTPTRPTQEQIILSEAILLSTAIRKIFPEFLLFAAPEQLRAKFDSALN